ncbi:hypothetical protein [Streptomyces sp. NPDC059071]|uniref:hypothetical protein n=1 Tax=unclassified Streptomyces TaxID=2593676 RepID=UPI003667E763
MKTLKRHSWPALAAVSALAVTSCASEPASPPKDRLCSVPAGSAEEQLLHTVIRTNTFRTESAQPRDQRFVERMEENLHNIGDPAATYTVSGCSYVPNGQADTGRAAIDFEWVPLDEVKKEPTEKGTREYRLNGATGNTNDVTTNLYVQCVMPGDLKEASKKVLLHTDAAFTVNLGPVHDHHTQDQQMAFVYRMTRRATEVLGCQNKPLTKDPVVEPLTESTSS